MKIEKLNSLVIMFEKHNFHSENHAKVLNNICDKINELIETVNEIIREDANTVVSMINHKNEIIMATKYNVYKLVNDEFVELKFTTEE